jgi:serine protease
MQKLLSWLIVILLLLLVACQPDQGIVTPEPVPPVQLEVQGSFPPLDGRGVQPASEINRLVLGSLLEQDEFRWSFVDDYSVWSAGMQTDSIFSIGYQPLGFENIDQRMHEIDVDAPAWQAVRLALIDFVVDETNRLHPEARVEAQDILAYGEKPLPYLNLQIRDYEVIAQLNRILQVRYVEPMGYGTEGTTTRSGKGCGNEPVSSLAGSDYTTVAPNAKATWNFYEHNIPTAWNYSQGDNITVGLIDTGVSPDQDQLSSGFSSGYSGSRFLQKYGTFVTGWWWWASLDGPNDDCGHGTAMGGTIAAPRGSTGSTVGVAYQSNLVSYRGTDDVVINESNEKNGVSDALYNLGYRSDVKIISMSLGDVFYSSQVADAVRYAYGRGKLIFSAAGTSLSWTSWYGVIFPATMSETVAVTGIETGSPMQRCDVCHDGSAVDFVVVMQDRNNADRRPLTLAMSGNTPARTGGSSVATATTAGVAALVWATNPSMGRNQVLQRLKDASDFYPSRSGSFGWGKIDALEAVAPYL